MEDAKTEKDRAHPRSPSLLGTEPRPGPPFSDFHTVILCYSLDYVSSREFGLIYHITGFITNEVQIFFFNLYGFLMNGMNSKWNAIPTQELLGNSWHHKGSVLE